MATLMRTEEKILQGQLNDHPRHYSSYYPYRNLTSRRASLTARGAREDILPLCELLRASCKHTQPRRKLALARRKKNKSVRARDKLASQ